MSIELFKEKGIKITKARITIYDILVEEDRGITAEEIYNACIKKGHKINFSTVYRTLEMFEEKQLVDKLNIQDDKKSYVIKKASHSHIVKCDLCHKEIQVPCPIKQFEELIKLQSGFKLTEHNITLKGICEDCNDEEN